MIGKAARMRASAQYVDLRQKCEMTSCSMRMRMAETRMMTWMVQMVLNGAGEGKLRGGHVVGNKWWSGRTPQ